MARQLAKKHDLDRSIVPFPSAEIDDALGTPQSVIDARPSRFPKEPDTFVRRIRNVKNGPIVRVNLEKCADSPKCSGERGGVCPHCMGARLTDQEREFIQSPRIGDRKK